MHQNIYFLIKKIKTKNQKTSKSETNEEKRISVENLTGYDDVSLHEFNVAYTHFQERKEKKIIKTHFCL